MHTKTVVSAGEAANTRAAKILRNIVGKGSTLNIKREWKFKERQKLYAWDKSCWRNVESNVYIKQAAKPGREFAHHLMMGSALMSHEY